MTAQLTLHDAWTRCHWAARAVRSWWTAGAAWWVGDHRDHHGPPSPRPSSRPGRTPRAPRERTRRSSPPPPPSPEPPGSHAAAPGEAPAGHGSLQQGRARRPRGR
ncbi:hypothetical protein QJS66_10890 [Kocuria rhizophila]|nr:hypothetical protein QJS66_10890 [Kocuria rhizophila]